MRIGWRWGSARSARDPLLDNAADKHAAYLATNLANGNLTALSHDEVTSLPGFFATTPLARIDLAGAPATEFVTEDVAGSGLLTNPAANAAGLRNKALCDRLSPAKHDRPARNSWGSASARTATPIRVCLTSDRPRGCSGHQRQTVSCKGLGSKCRPTPLLRGRYRTLRAQAQR